jgi:4-hydroxy-tetrahydrodipicolinate reductase
VKVFLLGRRGRVGSVLGPALEEAGHELVESTHGAEAAVDFTRPEAVEENVRVCLEDGVPVVVGTTGFDQERVAALARVQELPVFYAPNFALGAVLMLRFAAEAAKVMPHAEIVELHHSTKLDAPSGTAKATAALLPPGTPIHSVRLPGLVAHQEVIFGGPGQTLTIRHDTTSREAFVPGVLLALEKLRELPPGLTVGLDALLDGP